MSNRKIASVEINKKTIWIEVEQIDIIFPESDKVGHPSDLRESAKPVSAAVDYIKEKASTVGEILEAVVSEVDNSTKQLRPDEWSVELSLGFAGENSIPYIAKGEINSSVKVIAKWKKDSTEENKT